MPIWQWWTSSGIRQSKRWRSVLTGASKQRPLPREPFPDAKHGFQTGARRFIHPSPAWSDGVAIIGMSARFPRSRSVGEFWTRVMAGESLISTFSEQELRAAGVDELCWPAVIMCAAAAYRRCGPIRREVFRHQPARGRDHGSATAGVSRIRMGSVGAFGIYRRRSAGRGLCRRWHQPYFLQLLPIQRCWRTPGAIS